MTLRGAVEDMLRHMEWADALIWSTVFDSSVAMADTALKDRLYHIHVTQHAFLKVWRGLTTDLVAAAKLDVLGLRKWARAFYAEALNDSSWLDEAMLERKVPHELVRKAEERLGPGTMSPTIRDTIIQVLVHTAYHRGQVSTRLRQLGCEPPLMEYFVWVWRGKPEADWPADVCGTPE